MLRGSFDMVNTSEALGWAYAPGQREPVFVQAVLNQEVLGEAWADIYRPDLAAAGVGDGNAGFAIRFFRPIDPLYLPFISVKVDGGDAELPRSPSVGFKEFFSAMHVAFPTAARHRALNGGLWTDRIDAMALLQSKARIDALPAAIVPVLEQLISHGTAVFDLAAAPELSAWQADLTANTGKLLDNPAILTPLRSILEDNPIAVAADWVEQSETVFAQPSTRSASPSPGECAEIIIPFGDGVALDVIRSSHVLPEFTLNGKSRWTAPAADGAGHAASAMGLLDRVALPAGTAALIGPGTIYQASLETGTVALRILCLPVRGRTVSIASGTSHKELRKSGVMVLV